MKETITIREAVPADVPVLLEFEQGIVLAERPLNLLLREGEIHYYDLAELVASPDAGVFVGEVDGVPVASGYARIRDAKVYERHERYAYLGFMYVKPEFRGRGFNGAILDVLIEWSASRGLDELRLEVFPGNGPAIRAYEKAGFSPHLLEMRMSIAGGKRED